MPSSSAWPYLFTLLLFFLLRGAASSSRVSTFFPSSPPCSISRDTILALSSPGMSNTRGGLGYMEDSSARGTDNNARDRAAAGLTYIGQLLSHDLNSLDAGDFEQMVDIRRVRNKATTEIDLDTLYRFDGKSHPRDGENKAKLLMGNEVNAEDYPRNADGKARIADGRNDEHIIISQLSALFARFHNRLVDLLEAQNCCRSSARTFRRARLLVKQHWQAIILNDWLPLFVRQELIDDIRQNGRKWYVGRMWRRGDMPVEWSVGTHRLGHSIARGRYALNGNNSDSQGNPKLFRIFPLSATEALPENNLLGGRPIPADFKIEWNRFFNFSNSKVGDIADDVNQFSGLQVYRRIDRLFARPLMRLPVRAPIGLPTKPINGTENTVNGETVVSIATLDLLRGKSLGLPCGIQAAETLVGSRKLPLSEFNLFGPREEDGADLPPGSLDDVPFLLYILQEARSQNEGERLGEVGGRIEGEVILGLLEQDRESILNVRNGNWKSPITCTRDFSIVDLVNFVEGDLEVQNCGGELSLCSGGGGRSRCL